MAHGWLDPARKRQIESQRREAKEDAKREAAEKHKRVHTLALVELTISKAEFVAPSDDNGTPSALLLLSFSLSEMTDAAQGSAIPT